MIGLIVGDVLGSKHEFAESSASISSINFTGTFASDESIMALCIGEALLEDKDIIESLEAYYFLYPSAGWGLMYETWVCSERKQNFSSWGNGICARIAAHLYLSNGYEMSLEDALANAHLTHGEEGLKAVRFIVEFVYKIRSGMSKADLYQFAKSVYSFGSPVWVRSDDPLRESCQKSLPVALYALFAGSNFKEAVILAIQGSSDADSTGAICGLLAGELYGVPEDWASTAIAILDDRLRGVLESVIGRLGGIDKLGVRPDGKRTA